MLATTAADFVEFAERLDTVASKGSVAVVASETALGEANKVLSTEVQLRVRPALE